LSRHGEPLSSRPCVAIGEAWGSDPGSALTGFPATLKLRRADAPKSGRKSSVALAKEDARRSLMRRRAISFIRSPRAFKGARDDDLIRIYLEK
jgi:hypothetical protein